MATLGRIFRLILQGPNVAGDLTGGVISLFLFFFFFLA